MVAVERVETRAERCAAAGADAHEDCCAATGEV
jgi:hypothetical protein